MKSILFASFLLVGCLATAAITGLAEELQGMDASEGHIITDIADEMSYEFDCDLSPETLISLKAEMVLTDGDLQDEEYQEYEGELESFKVLTTVKLPKGCNQKGTYTCKTHFDLYDTKSYEVDRSQTSCEKAK